MSYSLGAVVLVSAGLAVAGLAAVAGGGRAEAVTIYPAPRGEQLSTLFTLRVEGRRAPVYQAKVAPADPASRWRAMDNPATSANYYAKAAFAIFDMRRPVRVEVGSREPVRSVRILPTSLGIQPRVRGRTVTFTLAAPRPVTVEVNGDWVGVLHIFANPPETDVPSPDDPNVIFFGPGIHEVTRKVVTSGQTVYVAGGAVVRTVVGPDEPYTINPRSGLRSYAPTFELRGSGIQFRGRGIVDASACPTHARNMILVRGSDITIEGVVLRDSSVWTMPIRESDRVTVRNVKIIGRRANSDGINICNSRDVLVEDCFIRTLDDLVVVKTDKGVGKAARIVVRRCVLWNEVAHALSVGAELREDVDDVLFEDSDIIRDRGREWTLRVFHSDAATVSNIRFVNLRIEESPRLASVWIGRAMWSRDPERGRVRGVLFRDIVAKADPLRIELVGYDADKAVEDVVFQNVVVNGRPLTRADVTANAYVRGVRVTP
ncbi:MAG TPA: glycosyl hydrolase family 28 protein [Chthonomonadales bacterium]|nr:glycosyl hydrolase family 28 protein [Chthonomonadales bacterium]